MLRKIIQIEEERCDGCGLCAQACHEGAIGMVNGKAKLLRDDYCDGLGDCLPVCPQDAIHFVEREAAAYDEVAVKEHMAKRKQQAQGTCACPGSASLQLSQPKPSTELSGPASQLRQWPLQIQLVPLQAPYYDGAELLIAADCTAYAYGNFHNRFMRGKTTLIGCPKLDVVDYSEKLMEIIKRNDIRKISVVRMQVPCCKGLEHAVAKAIANSGKIVPCDVMIITSEGQLL